jgi:hypothetical protein
VDIKWQSLYEDNYLVEMISSGDIYVHVFPLNRIQFKRETDFFYDNVFIEAWDLYSCGDDFNKNITLYPVYFRIVIFSRENGCNISGNGRYPLHSDNDDARCASPPSLSDAQFLLAGF